MAEVPRYQRGEKSSAAAPRGRSGSARSPSRRDVHGVRRASRGLGGAGRPRAPLCGRCVKFNNNAKPRKPREKVVPRRRARRRWPVRLAAQTLADLRRADADAVARLAPPRG